LTAADYDLLLSFDRKGPAELSTHLTESLPIFESSAPPTTSSNNACWCGECVAGPSGDTLSMPPILPTSSAGEARKSGRTLCCGHVAHDSCLQREISDCIQTTNAETDSLDATWRLCESVHCLHESCTACLFKGLTRKRRPKRNKDESKPSTATVDVNAAALSTITGVGPFALVGSGLVGPANPLSLSASMNPQPVDSRTQRLHSNREASALLRLTSRGLEVTGNSSNNGSSGLIRSRDISPVVSASASSSSRRFSSTSASANVGGDIDMAVTSTPLAVSGQVDQLGGSSRENVAKATGRRAKVGQFKALGKPPLPLSLPNIGQNNIVDRNMSEVAISSDPFAMLPDIMANGLTVAPMRQIGGPKVRSRGNHITTLRTLSASSAENVELNASGATRSRPSRVSREELDGPLTMDMGIGGVGIDTYNNTGRNGSSGYRRESPPADSLTASESRKRIVRGSTVRHTSSSGGSTLL
jgi:hypothetical protein